MDASSEDEYEDDKKTLITTEKWNLCSTNSVIRN